MSSSTFSSEHFRAWWRLPRRTRLWHAALLLSGVLAVQVCEATLRRALVDPRWATGAAEVLCIGHSRIRDGVDPGSFRRPVGKVTYPALDQAAATAVLRAHLDRWPRLRVVVLAIDEFTLFGDALHLHRDDLADLCGTLDLDATELDAGVAGEHDPDRDLWRWRNLLAGTGSSALHHRRRLTVENTVRATADRPGAERRKPVNRAAAELRVRHARQEMLSPNPAAALRRNTAALTRAIEDLRACGIHCILLCPPCSRAYEAARPKAWDTAIDRTLGDVRRRFPADVVTVWDDRRYPHASDDWFADVDHLRPSASRVYSGILDERLARSGLWAARAAPR